MQLLPKSGVDLIELHEQNFDTNYKPSRSDAWVMDISVTGAHSQSSHAPNTTTGNSTHFHDVDYVYDYDVIEQGIPAVEIVPVAIVYGLTLLFGVTGNTLVIISVTRYQRMRSITNIFLLSLASADLLLVCICIPVKFAAFFTFSWTFGVFLCKGVHYLQNVSSVCSVLTLTTMSMERYYAIRHPMRAKYVCTIGRAWRVTCVLWTLSIVLALPIIFQTSIASDGDNSSPVCCCTSLVCAEVTEEPNSRMDLLPQVVYDTYDQIGHIHKEVGEKVKAYWCVKDWETALYSRLYEIYMLCLMLLLPLMIMTFAYVSIIKELWAMASLRSSMTRGYVTKRSDGNGSSGQNGEAANGANGLWVSQRLGGITRFAFKSNNSSPSLANSTTTLSSPGRTSERSPVLRGKSGSGDGDDDKTKKQVIKMLVAVIVVFVVCWAPILVSNTLTAFGHLHYLNYGYMKPLRLSFYLLSYANSCINPVIYGFMSKHFRSTFYHALCTCLKSPRNTRSSVLHRQSSWQSRSTHIRDFGDLELTSVDGASCGHCNASMV